MSLEKTEHLTPGQSRPEARSFPWPFTGRLSTLIRARGYPSFRQFAFACGMPPQTIYAIMAGRPPRQFIIDRMLSTLGISPGEFYGRQD